MSCQEEIIAAIISDSPHHSSREFLCDVDLSLMHDSRKHQHKSSTDDRFDSCFFFFFFNLSGYQTKSNFSLNALSPSGVDRLSVWQVKLPLICNNL